MFKKKKTKAKAKKSKQRISSDWAKLLKSIPGYDPFHKADDYYFDPVAAAHVLLFFQISLTHVKGKLAKKPFFLENWQAAVLANLFGWKNKKTGLRRYRECFLYVPRKNGKSLLAAGVAIYLLFCDGEPGAEIVTAAAEKRQAGIVWGMAKTMVKNNPDLDKNCKIFRGFKSIEIERANSSLQPICADPDSAHGANLHGAVMDELHVQKSDILCDVIETSTGARDQPVIMWLTTADYDRISVCNTKLNEAKKVRDKIVDDPALLPVIYEADKEKDDWNSPKLWARVNPNYGVSLSKEYFKRQYLKAKNSPVRQNSFKRLHLNMKTNNLISWIDMDTWNACPNDINLKDLIGLDCFGGLDLASTRDLCALALYFPELMAVLVFTWCPLEEAKRRRDKDSVPYFDWVEEGHLEMTPGNATDHNFIRKRINELADIYNFKEIAFDRYNALQIAVDLENDGFEMLKFGQGMVSMSGPTKTMDRLIADKLLRHSHNPVLTWCASNVYVEQDAADNIKMNKKKSTDKIDPMVALVMAIGLATAAQKDKGSIYDNQGIETV